MLGATFAKHFLPISARNGSRNGSRPGARTRYRTSALRANDDPDRSPIVSFLPSTEALGRIIWNTYNFPIQQTGASALLVRRQPRPREDAVGSRGGSRLRSE